ncbi:X-linked retinitis pigmentosa GTPase regulator-interacting protein 1 [Carettochelys insculpta]|uniref:X-linked retinitis pigmentosa GTPase regulator-interacting protein 1 n=1 Tax=Carettochelys insculpta TaxID=44489 RepID=UPI003EB80A7D
MSVLLLDETAGDLPVRDSSPKASVITAVRDVTAIARPIKARGQQTRMRESGAWTRQHVSQVNRAELEDRFLRLHDENLVLKEFACKQEDRIKRLGSKLLRLTQERQLGTRARCSGQNLELEESLEKLQERVWNLERRNEGLRSQLLSYRQQLQLQDCRRHWPYSYVQARVDTGLRRAHTTGGRVPERRHRGTQVSSPEARPTHTAPARYTEHITDFLAPLPRGEEYSENPTLPDAPRSHSLVLAELETESQHLAWGREMDLEGALSQHQQALEHRAAIQGNVELIRLQRVLREQSCELAVTRGRFADLQEAYESQLEQFQLPLPWQPYSREKEESPNVFLSSHPHQNQETARNTSKALLAQVEQLTTQLKGEMQKVTALESKVQSISSLQGALEEFQERIQHLEKERDLLKEDYDKLLASRLICEHRQGDISRLEAQLSIAQAEKQQLVEELVRERARSQELQQEVARHTTLANQPPVQTPEPALSQLPTEPELEPEPEPEELSSQGSLRRRLHEVEAAHADTILELEKTRDMLILQHRINRDYQAELEGVMAQAEHEKRGHEEKQAKMAQLLDLRSTRIHQLEKQLKDVAYGTWSRPHMLTEGTMAVEEEAVPQLEHGENLFELHIAGAVLSREALQLLGAAQPVTFCTYAFYDFETHCTPVVRGTRPRYGFTSQYVVRAEPLFLQYLQGAATRLDLHLAMATDHSTLASCWLHFREVLGSRERVHATAMLHGPSGTDCGMLEYWARLHLPMEHTMWLHYKHTKALSSLSVCSPQTRGAQQSRQQAQEWVPDPEQLWHELQVQIGGCTGLRAHRLSTPPSSYAIYRFFTFPDHDTPIIPCSSDPCFGDLCTFRLHPTAELERYLRLENLCVYIFDDEDLQPGRFLGKAQIPLLPLARGHNITGDFVLTDSAGQPNGSISLSLVWKQRCLPLGATLQQTTSAREHQRASPLEQLIEKERAVLQSQTLLAPSTSPGQYTGLRKKFHISVAKIDGCRGKRRRRRRGGSSQICLTPPPAADDYNPEHSEVVPTGATEETPEGTVAQVVEQEAGCPAEDAESLHQAQSLKPRSLVLDTGSAPKNTACESALESSSDTQTTDSDEIVVGTCLGSPLKGMQGIRIEIISLSLHPEAEVMANEHIQQLYVEFHFPGVPLAETETPLSLRKPQGGEEIYFHFNKVIPLDREAASSQWECLFSMLQTEAAGQSWLQFVVVSEPPPGTGGECKEVGFAYVDLREILLTGSNLLEHDLEVISTQDNSVIGQLKVSVEAAAALSAIYWEGTRKAEEVE